MKIRRYKKVNKHLSFFTNTYGFRQPYQVLVDGTFCFAALNNKINIVDNIPRYLQGEIKLITTQCAIIEMENLGPKLNGALIILKMYGVHKCGHEGKPILGSECILSMLGKINENHYIVATQDRDLQGKVRNIPGVPLLYLHSKAPVLEQPSEVSVKYIKDKSFSLEHREKRYFEKLKEQSGLVTNEEIPRKRKKKGPNPLSCKKKKKPITKNTNTVEQPEKDKKKRKRIKIPQHVKEELLKIKKI